ncbi:AraC family transcriptional regulator [Oceanomicrobium pacificus]|uniref:Helix-turn-helix domain-containing protein n=1 Tax=Oceanomicrobium pacificus TaxID=2692916 RepID=A0A6B0TTW0_9RHOB|nr:AraC family transcriptional regulator [Oceanomicrobium pacificus]MXU64664.1 helix-turn-helix domain-containing protein [Oceanomicrobium pacificus]
MQADIRVTNKWLLHVAAYLRREGQGAVHEAALLDADLSPEEAQLDEPLAIPLQKEIAYFESVARRTSDPIFAVNASQMPFDQLELPGYVLKYSQDLRSGIRQASRFSRIVDKSTKVTLVVAGDEEIVRLDVINGLLSLARHHREFQVFLVLAMMRRITGQPIRPTEITFRHDRRTGVAEIERIAGCPVRFSAGQVEMRFRPDTLSTPIRSYDPSLCDILIAHGETLLAERRRDQPDLRSEVEARLVAALPDKLLDADTVAADLGMSRRTLSRRLTALGLSFRSIVEELRYALARRYLTDPGFSLAETAFLVGYTDQASFTSAFRRWSGSTPGQWRRELAETG